MTDAELFGASGHDILEMLVGDIQAGVIEIMAPPEVTEETQHAIALRFSTIGNSETRLLILLTPALQMGLLTSLVNAMMVKDISKMSGIDLDRVRDILRDGNGFV